MSSLFGATGVSGALSEVGAFLYSHSTDKYPQCVGAPYRHSCNASICLLHTCGRGSGCPDEAVSGLGVNIQCPGALPGPVTGGTDPINLRYRKTTAHARHTKQCQPSGYGNMALKRNQGRSSRCRRRITAGQRTQRGSTHQSTDVRARHV